MMHDQHKFLVIVVMAAVDGINGTVRVPNKGDHDDARNEVDLSNRRQ